MAKYELCAGWKLEPFTEIVSDRLVRLPFYTGLTVAHQDEVIAAVQESLA
jgi:dTDP-4-amino-4,6-dideoxygalactose transaminase